MSTHALQLSSPPDDVDTVHDFLERVWADASVEPMDRFRFETAVIELASNVIRHAAGPEGVTCTVTVEISEQALTAEFVDDGREGEIALDREMPDPFSESGRGIPLVRAMVDTVDYSRCGSLNRWRIEKSI